MKYVTIVFSLLLFGQVFGQKRSDFSITPIFAHCGVGFSRYLTKPVNFSQEYIIKKVPFSDYNGFDIGLLLGYQFSKKNKLQIGYQTSRAGTGFELFFKSPKYYQDINSLLYESASIRLSTNALLHAIPISIVHDFGGNENYNSNLHVDFDIKYGVNFYFKQKGASNPIISNWNLTTESSVIYVEATSITFSKSFGMGLNGALGTTFNWKDTRLFSLNLGFELSNANFINLPVTVNESGKTSIYRIVGTPSKLYFQLTRQFDFKRRKQKVLKES